MSDISKSGVKVKRTYLYGLMKELHSEADPKKFSEAQRVLNEAIEDFKNRLFEASKFRYEAKTAWRIYQQQNTPLRKLFFLLLDREPLLLKALDELVGKKNAFSIHSNHFKLLRKILELSPTDWALARNLGYYLCCPELCNIETNTADTLIRMLGIEPTRHELRAALPTWGHGDIYTRVSNIAGKARKSLAAHLNGCFDLRMGIAKDNFAGIIPRDVFYYHLYFGRLPKSILEKERYYLEDKSPVSTRQMVELEWLECKTLINDLFSKFSEAGLNQLIQEMPADFQNLLPHSLTAETLVNRASPHQLRQFVEKMLSKLPEKEQAHLRKREKAQALREWQIQEQIFKPFEQGKLNRVYQGFHYFCQLYIDRGIFRTHEHLARYAMSLVNPGIDRATFMNILQAMIIHLNERGSEELISHISRAYNALYVTFGKMDKNYPCTKSLIKDYPENSESVSLSDEVHDRLTDFSNKVALRGRSDNFIQRMLR